MAAEKESSDESYSAEGKARTALIAAATEVVIKGSNLHAAIREHRLALTNDARQSADELLQHLEKAAQDLRSLLRQEESYIQSDKSPAINSRTLVNGFLCLSFSEQRSVVEYLGFPDAGDCISPKQELHRRFFGWIRENKLIDRLQAEIGKSTP